LTYNDQLLNQTNSNHEIILNNNLSQTINNNTFISNDTKSELLDKDKNDLIHDENIDNKKFNNQTQTI
jgi:hypothetical protein